jgi:hypothetical protein
MQTSDAESKADKMLGRYELFVSRGRKFSTPDILPTIYPQVPSPVRANQLGQSGNSGGNAGSNAGGGG